MYISVAQFLLKPLLKLSSYRSRSTVGRKKRAMNKSVRELMYGDFATAPPGPAPGAPSSSQAGMQPPSSARAKGQPQKPSGQQLRRPGQQQQSYVGMDPKALVELKRIKDDTANEVEQNEMALKLCMEYMTKNSKESYEQFRDRFEFRNIGTGYDFYLH